MSTVRVASGFSVRVASVSGARYVRKLPVLKENKQKDSILN